MRLGGGVERRRGNEARRRCGNEAWKGGVGMRLGGGKGMGLGEGGNEASQPHSSHLKQKIEASFEVLSTNYGRLKY